MAVPAVPTVAFLGVHVEALLVTTMASAVMAQESVPDVAEPELPVEQVERSPSANGTVARCHPRRVCWVDDEAGVASRKARVVVGISSSPPPVPAGHYGSSAKTDPASDRSALRPDASNLFSASPASCAS